jgi:hypothetical protein
MKMNGGIQVQFDPFLTSVLDGSDWSTSAATELPLGEEPPSVHEVGGWGAPQSQSGPCEEESEVLPLLEMETQCLSFSPYPSRYTDWAIASQWDCWSKDIAEPEYRKMKTYKGMEVKFQAFITPAVDKGRWIVRRFSHFNSLMSLLIGLGSF